MKSKTSPNKTFLRRRLRSSVAKRNVGEADSGDTSNQLSLPTRSRWSLKLLERQECQTLGEISCKNYC
ncbi:hypothetical protein [Paenibacillus glacialis]|uniref:hypothetical protein n=1 Tax=Paenibacillus glacialis TaxID=494026 RepID=UPI0011AB559E|nr:hypothetical protein [Paenibacillus glacialis]